MRPAQEVDYVLHDCFFALGQAVGLQRHVDFEAIVWWRTRYRDTFLRALTDHGDTWPDDRRRLTAVGRFLGQRALHHAGDRLSVDRRCAELASVEVETGCRMHAPRNAVLSVDSARDRAN